MATHSRRGERAWRAVQRVADDHRESVRRRALRAVRRGQEAVDLEQLATAAERNDPGDAERLLLPGLAVIETHLRHDLPSAVFDTLVDGARAGLDRQGRLVAAQLSHLAAATPQVAPSVVPFAFDATNPEAQQWAARYSSAQIVEISTETRAAIRAIVERAFRDHLPPRTIARLIQRQVGLTSQMAEWVAARREKAMAQVLRGKTTLPTVLRQIDTFAQTLLRRRALNIARTETIDASNEGQRQLWRQAQQAGHLSAGARREWITTPSDRTCERCLRMDGRTAPIDGPFETPEGRKVMGPTLHPSCRCAVGLTRRAA